MSNNKKESHYRAILIGDKAESLIASRFRILSVGRVVSPSVLPTHFLDISTLFRRYFDALKALK